MTLNTIFCPRSIALIGASRDEHSVGYSLLQNLLTGTYHGNVYPVNPKAQEILGKKAYPSLAEIEGEVDLAVLAVPAAVVPAVMETVVQKGIHAVIVISAGFKESGSEGKAREEWLVNFCKEHDIALIGPNCLGVLNPHIGLNASFETVLPNKGSIAFISQSGALISSLLDIANERGIGFSKIISVGNKSLITEHELLPYLFADQETSVILIYAETLQDAPRLIKTMQENIHSDHPKAVILLKAGASQAGQKASSSHTGSLAGTDAAYEALVAQAGILRVHTVDELLSTAHVFAKNSVPGGNQIAIVTNAGGPGIIATDESERRGLLLSPLSQETQDVLKTVLPASSHIANPIDVLGDANAERYDKALQAVSQDSNVHQVLTIVTPQSMTDIVETAHAVVRARDTSHKPIVASFMGAPHVEAGVTVLNENGIAHTQFPEDAITALGHLSAFRNIQKKERSISPDIMSLDPEVPTLMSSLTSQATHLVNTETTFRILAGSHIPIVPNALAQSKEEASKYAATMGPKVVLKIVSPDISHKTDIGGVKLNVSHDQVTQAFQEILDGVAKHAPTASTHGILVSEMVQGEGTELIVGMKREEGLGTLILLGLGGVYVELFKDTMFRFAPLTRQDAIEMIDGLKAKPLLYGFRGSKKRDIEAVINVLLQVSQLAQTFPEITELDINPLFVKEEGNGAVVLDARIILK